MANKKNKYRFFLHFITIFLVLHLTNIPALALTIEQERRMGEQLVESVKYQMNVLDDNFIHDYINKLGQYLAEALVTKHFPYNFYVVEQNELNAFAGPGGHIFIFTGLIEAMDGIDELAAIICHEIAHVSLRHVSQRFGQYTKISMASLVGLLAGILAGGNVGEAIMTGSLAAAQQKMLNYSRDDERQADQAGFEYTLRSGFDPRGIRNAFNKLQRGQWGVNKVPAYLFTHPLGPERIANIDALLANAPPPAHNDKTLYFRRTYPLFRTVIMAGHWDEKSAEQHFRNEVNINPESPLSHLGMAIVLKNKADYENAIRHFKIAEERLDEPEIVLNYLSETYLLKGEYEKALETLESVLKKDPHDKSALFLLANVYKDKEKYSKAAEIYEKLKRMEPVRDVVFYDLGISYGRENILGPAHYNFGIYFMRQNRPDQAQFHFKKALEEAEKDPELIELIKKAREEMMKDAKSGRRGRDTD